MSFGIANNVKSEVRACTPDLLNAALDSVQVAKVCAELEDALEKCRRGEIAKEDYETLKGALKKKLPILRFMPPSRTADARTMKPSPADSPFTTSTT